MRFSLYIVIFTLLVSSCITSQNFTMEDDIYYIPGRKALAVQEIEKTNGTELTTSEQAVFYPEKIQHSTHPTEIIYENSGYWMGGYKGNERDLDEIERIINLYPQGFAFTNVNGFEIALNLSFDPDWNVYTKNGRYWWFPSYTNLNLYSSLLLGNYPKLSWTIAWESPRFNVWNYDYYFNWGFRWNWGYPGWNISFGWNSGWYDPWYYHWQHPWYGHYPNRYYPYYNHPHWGNRPHWGNNHRPAIRPNSPRPSVGNTIQGIRPNSTIRPGNLNSRPSSTTPSTTIRKPSNHSINRPSSTTRPGHPNTSSGTAKSEKQPIKVVRPGANARPGTTIQPTTTTKQNNFQQSTNSTTRPGSITRPGNINRPENNSTRQGNNSQPKITTRPGNVNRPNTTTRPSSSTRTTNSSSKNKNTQTIKSKQRTATNSSNKKQTNNVTRPAIRSNGSNWNFYKNSSSSNRSNQRQTPPTQTNRNNNRRR